MFPKRPVPEDVPVVPKVVDLFPNKPLLVPVVPSSGLFDDKPREPVVVPVSPPLEPALPKENVPVPAPVEPVLEPPKREGPLVVVPLLKRGLFPNKPPEGLAVEVPVLVFPKSPVLSDGVVEEPAWEAVVLLPPNMLFVVLVALPNKPVPVCPVCVVLFPKRLVEGVAADVVKVLLLLLLLLLLIFPNSDVFSRGNWWFIGGAGVDVGVDVLAEPNPRGPLKLLLNIVFRSR